MEPHGICTQLHAEKLPEGVYFATSGKVQNLVAQGNAIQEALEIARNVTKKLLKSHRFEDEHGLGSDDKLFDGFYFEFSPMQALKKFSNVQGLVLISALNAICKLLKNEELRILA